ncbi:MAG: chloride channel protein [Pseudomonadota bacterium]
MSETSPESAPTDSPDPGQLWAQVARVVVLGLLTGLAGALLANAFVAAIGWLNEWLLISPRARMMAPGGVWLPLATVTVPALGGLLVGYLHRWVHDKRPHGPADVIAAVQTRQGHLPTRPALATGISSLVSLGSGASVGQYGPLVHMGGSLGALLARLLRSDVTVANIAIACGVAAAIATAFNAPIAGILFAHEVILRHYALRAFAPVALAAITGYVVANAVLTQPPLFQIEAAEVAHLWEFALFPVLGIASALVAVAYMHTILGVGRMARRLPLPDVTKPALAGMGLGLVALWVPDILGIGAQTLRFAFIEGAYAYWELLLVLVLKLLATAWCLGMGFSGGVFSPALVIGSLFGALFGSVLGLLLGGDTSAIVVFAVCGMVAVTAPVIGAPLTTVVIVFELTGSYELTIAALASVALANLVASRIFGRSFFDRQLRDRNLDLSRGRSKALLASSTIAELVSTRHVTVAVQASVGDARHAMHQADATYCHLVDADGRYAGTLRLQRLLAIPAEAPARDYRGRDEIVMTADTTVWDAMNLLRDFVGEGVAVVDPGNRLLGTVFVSDLIGAYLDILDDMRQEEYATR